MSRKKALLTRFKEDPNDTLETDPTLAKVSEMTKSVSIPNIQFLNEPTMNLTDESQLLQEQPFISSIRAKIGTVEIEGFQGSRSRSTLDFTLKTDQDGFEKRTLPPNKISSKSANPSYYNDTTTCRLNQTNDQGSQLLLQFQKVRKRKKRHDVLNVQNQVSVTPSQKPIHDSKENVIPKRPLHSPHLRNDLKGDFKEEQRKLSVIVAMTPAQRIEKHPGMGSGNALASLQLCEQIGRGAHGVVFKALNKETNQYLAVKVMKCDKDELAGLMGEIDLLKILKHKNIVKYHGFVKTSDSLNVILEFCSGGSLRQLYKRLGHGIPEPQVISYVKQILEGLHYLHDQGVVHRDVKAANMLLSESGEVKLADFGVATTVATLHNTVVGTPHWMAPETVLGGDGSCTASDIWSLGATIIELLTMNPPYHDLVPMAAIHAIVNNEHPSLPHALSPTGQNFLLECFQKTPAIRKSAALLLQHWWLNDNRQTNGEDPHTPVNFNKQRIGACLIESNVSNSERDHDSRDKSVPLAKNHNETKYSRAELLVKFQEASDDEIISLDSFDSRVIKEKLLHQQASQLKQNNEIGDVEEEHDRFSKLEICEFHTKENDKESEMAHLLAKLSSRIALYSLSGEEIVISLSKITLRIYALLRDYPNCVHVLQKDHGVILFMDLLDYGSELPREERLWYLTLGSLNCLFAKDISQIESFSTLGGIPKIIQFSKPSYGSKVKAQLAKFLRIVEKSEVALRMLVASGGLLMLSRFLQEDIVMTPEFPLVSVSCVHEILSKDLSCSRSDLCRTLSKYGIMFWFVKLLTELTKSPETPLLLAHTTGSAIEKILVVINCFGLAGAKVQALISNPDIFKILIKVYTSLPFSQQLIILKFFKAISSVTEVGRHLVAADILEFYVTLLSIYSVGAPNYKEVLNLICPSIFQCCLLNYERQTEFVKLGAVPHLQALCAVDLQIRQFILPIFFELVHCDSSVRQILLKYNAEATYFALVKDPYWSYNAIDSLLHWGIQDKSFQWLQSQEELACIVKVFLLNQILNLEAFLDIYYQVMVHHRNLTKFMTRGNVIKDILAKLTILGKSAAVKVTLLKILLKVVKYNAEHKHLKPEILSETYAAMKPLASSSDPNVLASSLASRIMVVAKSCR